MQKIISYQNNATFEEVLGCYNLGSLFKVRYFYGTEEIFGSRATSGINFRSYIFHLYYSISKSITSIDLRSLNFEIFHQQFSLFRTLKNNII